MANYEELISKAYARLNALATLSGVASGHLSSIFLELKDDEELPTPVKNRTLRQTAAALLKMDKIWMEQYCRTPCTTCSRRIPS